MARRPFELAIESASAVAPETGRVLLAELLSDFPWFRDYGIDEDTGLADALKILADEFNNAAEKIKALTGEEI